MPAAAHPRATLPTRPPRLVRALLLAALTAGLAGLALPSRTAAPGALAGSPASPTRLTAASERREPNPARPLLPPVPAPAVVTHRHAAPHASRSRPLGARWVRPVAAGIVSPYGMRWGRLHPGVDFGARYGAPIHAVGAGVVVGAGYLPGEDGYGQIILIRHADGVVTAYAHTSRMLVHAGQRVRAGDVIGLVGATGHVTGPHLHFEVRIHGVKVDPLPWLRAHGIRV